MKTVNYAHKRAVSQDAFIHLNFLTAEFFAGGKFVSLKAYQFRLSLAFKF